MSTMNRLAAGFFMTAAMILAQGTPDPQQPDPQQPDTEKPDPQQPDTEKPDPQQPNFQDLLRQLDKEGAQEIETPAADDLTAPVDGAGSSQEATLSEKDRNEAITRNYGRTVEIYDSILSEQETNTGRIDQRIARVEQMIADYTPKYEQNASVVRGVEAELVAVANRLKSDLDAGRIDKARYEKELHRAEKRAESRMSDAKDQRDFYGAEIKRAQTVLAELRQRQAEIQRNLDMQRQADIASGKIQPPEPGYLEQILQRHRKLGVIAVGNPTEDADWNRAVMRTLTSTD